jgi:hypothetical protein
MEDAGPNVRLPKGLPITAGCDAAWIRTRETVTPHARRYSALDHCATHEFTLKYLQPLKPTTPRSALLLLKTGYQYN